MSICSTSDVYIRVVVAYSLELINISSVIGWCYFVAWSISFYPQIYINFRRKSVVGLNFDFISLNVVGFVLYAIFNVGLYSVPEIQVLFLFNVSTQCALAFQMNYSNLERSYLYFAGFPFHFCRTNTLSDFHVV